jgi:mobilome CxxCx(11)CxxC protein
MTKEEQIRTDCWDKSFHALGTSYVFSHKLKAYKMGLRIITVLVLVVPLFLGGTVMAYGEGSKILSILIVLTAPVVIIHLLMAIFSLIYKWDDKLAYFSESQSENRIISEEYENIAKYPPTDISELHKRFEVIKTKDNARAIQDEKYTFSDKDNRRGMRYALWIRKKECATCKIIPLTMTPSDCETCGNF